MFRKKRSLQSLSMKKNNLGIYIHIPFCESKCFYCDFNSGCEDVSTIDMYMESLYREVQFYGQRYSHFIIDSIFIGGGTPTSIKPIYISRLMECLYENFQISLNCETTLEGNPNSLTEDKLMIYMQSKINRLSMGAQSFVLDELKSIGRIHKVEDVAKAVRFANDVGFDNINIDLMMGLPNQTLGSLEYSVNEAVKLDVEHISCYSLILEENTPLYDMYMSGMELNFPKEETERNMYNLVPRLLADNNFAQYEISNFAKVGYECKHNMKYWKCGDYLGLGVSAHGRVGDFRYSNTDMISEYSELLSKDKLPITFKETLSKKSQINEEIIMALRLNCGLNISKMNKNYNLNFEIEYKHEIEKNIKAGLIEIEDEFMKLTKEGRNFSNIVELDFYRLEE